MLNPNMVNTSHDAGAYGQSCYMRDVVSDGDKLYTAYKDAVSASWWKGSDIQFRMYYLSNLYEIQQAILNRTFRFSPASLFYLQERGKIRLVRGESVPDRVVGHLLCDYVLCPAIYPHLIHDNGACITDKGVDFTRRRLVTHLSRFYRQYGNKGYILIMDYSKYYDNIRHETLYEHIKSYIPDDELALWLVRMQIEMSRLDVSDLTDEEYLAAEEGAFDSAEFFRRKHSKDGVRYLGKHLFMGDQFAQIAGVTYASPVDTFVKTVKGEKYYARYMDDSYVMHPSKEHLEDLLEEIIAEAKRIGITINRKKTRIMPLSQWFPFLQIRYRLTATGRIARKVKGSRVTRERRKLKRQARVLTKEDFIVSFSSWYGASKKLLSGKSRKAIRDLFESLLATMPETEEPSRLRFGNIY